jgi:hypothetical protein
MSSREPLLVKKPADPRQPSFFLAEVRADRNKDGAPGYYYRGDHLKLDDANWHCFTLSRYDRNSKSWAMEKAPVYHIID